MKNLPDYLYSLSTEIALPTQTSPQELPFNDLTWDNFERLTLRYAELLGEAEYCHLYGKAGQKQEGIDLFVRHGSEERYTVYQCKRYKDYNVSNLKNAVSTFLKGKWVNKTKTFYICTSCELNERNLADEIENQSRILNDFDIKLLILDKVKFSSKLKEHPKLVYDFFGKEWTKVFCGEDELSKLTRRLDVNQFSEYKHKLGKFYGTLFENHEGSISNLSGQNSCPNFEVRYIIPDVISNIDLDTINSELPRSKQQVEDAVNFSYDLDIGEGELYDIESSAYQNSSNIENRTSALDWIASENNTIVVGGAGSGKSALLKYVVLGLLDQIDISESKLQKNRHNLIPVWLPFGYWTNYLETTPNASLLECMKSWFRGMDHDDLWPLIESAISDDRLLLVIDGLDEWSSKQTALICLQKLTVFIQENDASSILSTRPSGIERLGMNTTRWSIGHLTGLSDQQQEKLIKICVEYRLKNQQNIDAKLLKYKTTNVTQELVSEISRSTDLLDLASVPLLIYMLIHLKTKNISLPHSRFEVYKELVFDLVKVQPQRRRTAAQVTNAKSIFSESELISILSRLAYDIQVDFPHGNVPMSSAKSFITKYLSDDSKEFGLNKREALRHTDEFINIGESEVGILVKKSNDEVGFFHRTLQEFLAALYLSTESNSNQELLLKKYIFNEQWQDVFLGLFSSLQRNSDVENLVKYIIDLKCTEHQAMLKELMLAEIAFGDNKCSANTAKKVAYTTFDLIEKGNYLPHKDKLLNIVLRGYNSSKLHEEIYNKLTYWIPEKNKWFISLLEGVKDSWVADDITRDLLVNCIVNKDIHVKKTASKLIVDKFNSDSKTLSLLMSILKSTLDLETRMIISKAIFKGWFDSKEAKSIYNNLKSSSSEVANLLRVFYETKSGVTNDSNRSFLIKNSNFNLNVSYHWNDLLIECLLLGYSDDTLKALCIQRVFGYGANIEFDIAHAILFTCFYKDNDLIEAMVEDFKNDLPRCLSMMRNERYFISKVIDNSDLLKSTIETWLLREKRFSYRLYILFKSDGMKELLLNDLSSGSSFVHWSAEALIKNWGVEDPVVNDSIFNLINKGPVEASKIAHLYPIIFKDKNTCYRNLIKLLECSNENRIRYDFIIQAILQVSNKEQKNIALKVVLNKSNDPKSSLNEKSYSLWFGKELVNEDVKKVAVEEINRMSDDIGLVASLFNDDDDFRGAISNNMKALSAPLRTTIVSQLRKQNTDITVCKLLESYNLEVEPSIKTLSAIGLYTSPLSSDSQESNNGCCDKLKKELFAVGLNHEAERQAALCGIISSRNLNEAKDLGDPYSNKGFNFAIGYLPSSNEVYYSYLAKEWDYISSVYPEFINDLPERERFDFFTNISPHIDGNDYLKAEFKSFIHNEKGMTNDRILLAASKIIPGDKYLLMMCFNRLGLSPNNEDIQLNNSTDSLLSLHILHQQFSNSDLAREYLIDVIDFSDGRLDIVLAVSYVVGFSDELFMKKIKTQLKGKAMWIPTHFHSISNVRGNVKKIEKIVSCLSYLKDAPKHYSKYFCNVVSVLINRSDGFSREFVKSIKSEVSVQIKLQLITLYVQSKGLNPAIKNVAIELYNKQKKKILPDIIFDVSKGEFSVATMVLTNILYKYD